jgi:hypothetical protein
MLIASPRTHAFIFLTIGLVLLAIYCAGPGLTERSVKQKVSLQPNQKYRVKFVIAGSSDPALVVVDLAGTSFQLRLKYLRISYSDPVRLGVADIRVSEFSR